MSDRPVPDLLYHYTDMAGLAGIIESRTLWATHIQYLNDESEVRYSRELLGSVAEHLREESGDDWATHVVCEAGAALATSQTTPDTFVVSFCEDGDSLGQWRGYGGHGRGFAIGFDRDRLREVAHPEDYSLIRTMYDESEQVAQLDQAVRDCVPILAGWAADPATAPSATNQLLLLGLGLTFSTLSIKNPYFQGEREWRLARVHLPGLSERQRMMRTRGGVTVPYEEVPLADAAGETPIVDVVIGPMARSDETRADIRGLLERNALTRVVVRESIGPLRA